MDASAGKCTLWAMRLPSRFGRVAGIANLKMRDLEKSMLQLWKQHVGADFSVIAALSATQPMKSLQGQASLDSVLLSHELGV